MSVVVPPERQPGHSSSGTGTGGERAATGRGRRLPAGCRVLCCAVQCRGGAGGGRGFAELPEVPPEPGEGLGTPGAPPKPPPPPPGSCDRPSGGAGPVLERAEPRKEHGRERAARDGGGGGRGGGGGGVYRRGGFTLGLQRLAGGAAISFLTLWQHIASVRDWAP